jgi:hypothetical protein
MPIRDLVCKDCGAEWEEIVNLGERPTCRVPECDSFNVELKPALIGGYQGSMGGASTRPRHCGSFKVKKRSG